MRAAVGGAVAGGAVEDHLRVAVGHDALDARLQIAAGHVLGAGQVSGGELLGLAHVDDRDALVDQLVDLGRVDLLDLALDLAEKLRCRSGLIVKLLNQGRDSGDFKKYSDGRPGLSPPAAVASVQLGRAPVERHGKPVSTADRDSD